VIADQPLAGKRIVVTRARHQAGELSAELEKLGGEAIEVPAIEIVPPISFGRIDKALRNLRQYEWLIVTSANAVRAIRDRMAMLKIELSNFAHLKIAAVGATTARALEGAGLVASVIPKEYVAESLIEALGEETRNLRVLIVRAAIARDVIPEALEKRGAQVQVLEAYRTIVPQSSIEKIKELFAGEPPNAATFTSSSTVTNFFQLLHEAGYDGRPKRMAAISIGPVTSQTLRDHEWEPAAEADPHDVSGLVAATVRALGGSAKR
jgi:uroporphyrinogen-III synthase